MPISPLAGTYGLLRRRIISSFVQHLNTLIHYSDPVQSLSTEETANKSNFHLALLIVLLYGLYGTIGLQYQAGLPISPNAIHTSPYILTHQVCPHSVWSQIDFGLGMDIVWSILVYIVLIMSPNIKDNFRFYQDGSKFIVGAKELAETEATKLIQFRKKAKLVLNVAVGIFFVLLCTFFLTNVLLNNVYGRNVQSILYWAFFPVFMFYIFYALLCSMMFIILASRVIGIRQKILLLKFQNLNSKITKSNLGVKNSRRGTVLRAMYWLKFKSLNYELVNLCKCIKEYSHFSTPLLSVIFPFYICVQCYLIYIILFIDIPIAQKQIFYVATGEVELFLFVITNECALVTKFNQKFELENHKFYLNYLFRGGFKSQNCRMIKADYFQKYRRLHSYAFRLVGNYRITSKTFYLILSYISIFFMFLVKDFYSFNG